MERVQRLQYSLVDCNFRPGVESDGDDDGLTYRLVEGYCHGRWESILKDPMVRSYLSLDGTCPTLTDHRTALDNSDEVLIQLTISATLLCVYTQINFTGPSFQLQPVELFDLPPGSIDQQAINSSSLENLSLAGEPAYHLTKSAAFLLWAIKLIDRLARFSSDPENPLSSILNSQFHTLPWWSLRASFLQRRLLDESVPFPQSLLSDLENLSQKYLHPLSLVPDPSSQEDCWNSDLLPELTLERGLAEHLSGNEKTANLMFRRSVTEAKLDYTLTGILGKRTKFQEKDISQLVVLAKGRNRFTTKEKGTDNSTGARVEGNIKISEKPSSNNLPATLQLNDDTLLEKTHFTQTTDSKDFLYDPTDHPDLHPLDQSILLALSLSIKNTSPSHGLTKAQMSPFIERVLQNPANWSVHSMALLIRSRLEAHRTRTVERGLLQLQALVDQLTKEAENDPLEMSTALERVRWTWSLSLPSNWELERELANKLSGMGVTRSALEIFEKLEMWEDVVQCHLSLDNKQLGIKLVKELLDEVKVDSGVKMIKQREKMNSQRRGKLYCLLGELESDPKHWETAWEVSQHSSSRAMRSLGAHYFSKGNYKEAIKSLSLALSINPLFDRAWFILGCAAMRDGSWNEAELGFRRCVSLNDEDAEAWNNLATVYLKLATDEESDRILRDQANKKSSMNCGQNFDSFESEDLNDEDEDVEDTKDELRTLPRPIAAFRALQQAVKLSYDSWRMWTNYMLVAISVKEYIEASRALGRVVEVKGEKGLDLTVLERLVEAAILKKENDEKNEKLSSRLAQRLEELIDKILIVKCPNEPKVWEARSQLCLFKGDFRGSIEKRLQAYRVGVCQTEDWISDPEAWKGAVKIVESLIDSLVELGPRVSKDNQNPVINWRWQSKTVLNSFLNKSKDSFEFTSEWTGLENRLLELKNLS
ncbi:hypothetical protein BY996DRAFT_4575418 [Phakopsora pachyrhizi]|nr:hypothetical protein BY996DRAFT_4575418 [Phakopsora pachyrhizi]